MMPIVELGRSSTIVGCAITVGNNNAMQKATNVELTHLFILLLLLSAEASGQNVVKAQAQVESQIARQRYCSVGSRSASLLITFDARIRNTSDSPIELS